jgi:basic membrane protein A
MAGADRVLTSAVLRVDAAVQASVEARQRGVFAAGTLVFGVAQGGVGLAPFHQTEALVTEEMRQRLAEIEAGLADGTIETGVAWETGFVE